MKTKKFRIDEILTYTTERLVAERHMDAVYDIANFMTGDSIFTHQLPRVARLIKAELNRQLPWTDSPEMQFETGKLILMLETPTGKAETGKLIRGWISKQIATYGEWHEVEAFTKGSGYEFVDPIFEAVDMMGGDPDRVLEVKL